MTPEQRAAFAAALYAIDMCEEARSDRSARAGHVADALRILSARLDEFERRMREDSPLHTNQT